MVKVQVVTAYVSTTFLKCPLLRASCCNLGCSSFQTHIIPPLVSCFTLFDNFLTLHLFLGATTKGWKESIGFLDSKIYAESFEKKIINKIKYSRSLPHPDFLGVTISSHIISFRFLPILGHLQHSGKPNLVD